jgi:hypothetical protein
MRKEITGRKIRQRKREKLKTRKKVNLKETSQEFKRIVRHEWERK